jgi:chorismate synthase
MSGIWGKNIKYSIFGESHGKGIGVVIDGLPAGIPLDLAYIQLEMERRRPGKNQLSTPRKEEDKFEIISGYFNGYTTGTPLCALIWNTNQHSKDYEKLKLMARPGHGDYTGYIKYNGFQDYRGGGHFSGRLTAPIVLAGAIAKQFLESKNIFIGSHIAQIGHIHDHDFDGIMIQKEQIQALKKKDFTVMDDQQGCKMKELIHKVKAEKDSIGGVVEGAIIHLPPGLGGPYFEGVEGMLSHILFSIPAVKGIEFGAGFNISKMKGSQANDLFYSDHGEVKTNTNHSGGILGGITNGMPVVFRVAFKPTPSIGKLQKTINLETKESEEIAILGRHDPCIVPRAVPVVEAAAALGILDLWFSHDHLKDA